MKTTDQRIAIAVACGLKPCSYHGVHHTHQLSECTRWECSDAIPDYLNDLNAMHEAEKTLTMEQGWKYLNQIALLQDSKDASDFMNHFCWHSPAAQRAEAFLKTLNLWTP